MMLPSPSAWYTAAELADLRLPGLPGSKKAINNRAASERWTSQKDEDGAPLARKRSSQGGGWEYHVRLLPHAARAALAKRVPVIGAPIAETTPPDHDPIWDWYGVQNDGTKAEAERRLAIVQEMDALTASGASKSVAVAEGARRWSITTRTIWQWLGLIQGVPTADWLPYLAPRRAGGGVDAEIDTDLWQFLLSDFLRLSRPSWSSCVRRAVELAKDRQLALPHEKTLWRRFEKLVHPDVVTLRREGLDALRKNLPPQKRSVAKLHALELVNIDGHTCDVRVEFPDGRIGRPVLIAIQDVYSRKFLAWRYSLSEDAITARLCFADLFKKYGIPKGLLSDNGRAFACKWLSGGAPTRFRFKVKPEDPVGVLTMLGIKIHWALPFRGQSKPIERGFRDFCDAIAKHPAFEGAYTGNNALNKPDNYGERAVSWETFTQVWDAGIRAHNARTGRRTEMGRGKFSFDEVFDKSYAVAPISKASPDQLRLALFAAEQVRADKKSGAIKLLDNRYWSPDLARVKGDLVTVRFDPEDAHQPVHVFDQTGAFIATADLWEADGFTSAEAAKRRARLEADHKKATKNAAQTLNLLEADRLAAMLPTYEDEAPPPEPSVIRPVRARGVVAAALKPTPQDAPAPAQSDLVDRFTAGFARHLRVVE